MSIELGTWLRVQREARGWSRADMARRLIAARKAGDDATSSPENLRHSIYRWERGLAGISRPHQRLICRAFGIAPAGFGHLAADGHEADQPPENGGAQLYPEARGLRGVSYEDEPLAASEPRLTAGEHLPRGTDRMSDFGFELGRWMRERGIGVRELHRRSGYSAAYITQLRQGQRNPKADTARDLDDALSAGGVLAATAPVRAAISPVHRRAFIGLTGASVFETALEGVHRTKTSALATALTALGGTDAYEQPGHIDALAAAADRVRGALSRLPVRPAGRGTSRTHPAAQHRLLILRR